MRLSPVESLHFLPRAAPDAPRGGGALRKPRAPAASARRAKRPRAGDAPAKRLRRRNSARQRRSIGQRRIALQRSLDAGRESKRRRSSEARAPATTGEAAGGTATSGRAAARERRNSAEAGGGTAGPTGLAAWTSVQRRIGAIFAVLFLLLVLAAGRTAYLGVVRGAALRKAASNQQITDETVNAQRGTISDRMGVDLAVSEPARTSPPIPTC